MPQNQISSNQDILNLIENTKIEATAKAQALVPKLVEDVVEGEFDLLEFNLFISTIGKEKLNEASEKVAQTKKEIEQGKLEDFGEYEKAFEEFE